MERLGPLSICLQSEENVWHLAKSMKERCTDEVFQKCFVVFISNSNESIPLWRQKAGKNSEGFVIWVLKCQYFYTLS